MIEETNVDETPEKGSEAVVVTEDDVGSLEDVFDPEVATEENTTPDPDDDGTGPENSGDRLLGEGVGDDEPLSEEESAATPDPEGGPAPKPSYHQQAAQNAARKNKRKYG